MKRKDFLRWLGIGGAGTIGGIALNKVLESGTSPSSEICSVPSFAVGGASQNRLARIGGGRSYGSMVHPPGFVKEGFLSRFEFPRNTPLEKKRSFDFHIEEIPVTIAHDTITNAWTFNGMAPGPVIRCTLGDDLTIRFRNTATGLHSMHFHGSHDPGEDG
ncbi:MAG: multicopper oxidase domain-containing protein, partial [Leptospira sp.]|nr:multicopper oxidase domain-containing protein [Leptospira sp.]